MAANNSGSLPYANRLAASNVAFDSLCISANSPQRANAKTKSALAIGHTEPRWYENGLYAGCRAERVRMPHPENKSSRIMRSAT